MPHASPSSAHTAGPGDNAVLSTRQQKIIDAVKLLKEVCYDDNTTFVHYPENLMSMDDLCAAIAAIEVK
jgi:hypothetical protein